jgi:hypothetical protein
MLRAFCSYAWKLFRHLILGGIFFLSFCPSESYSSNGLVNPISCWEHCRNSQHHVGGCVCVCWVVVGGDPNQVTEPYFAYQKMGLIWQMMTYFGLARIRADIYFDAVPTSIYGILPLFMNSCCFRQENWTGKELPTTVWTSSF